MENARPATLLARLREQLPDLESRGPLPFRCSSTASLIALATAAGSARSSSTTTIVWLSNRGGTPNVSGWSASSRSRAAKPARITTDVGSSHRATEPVVDVPRGPRLGALALYAVVRQRETSDVVRSISEGVSRRVPRLVELHVVGSGTLTIATIP